METDYGNKGNVKSEYVIRNRNIISKYGLKKGITVNKNVLLND